jgi:ABC-type bacteriocin/lantibiotic exporter with double-glycine peptidase domain
MEYSQKSPFLTLKRTLSILFFLVCINLISGCGITKCNTSKGILSNDEMNNAFLLPVKFYKQKEPDKCGVTALKTVLDYFNIDYSDIESIFNKDIKATRLITIINYANKYLDAHTERIGYGKMVKILRNGSPVIILRKYEKGNHYYVVKGFILDERKIVVNNGYEENVILPASVAETDDIAVIFNQKGKELVMR